MWGGGACTTILEIKRTQFAAKTGEFSKGFDFNYFTSIYTTKSGTIYYFIYDQGYLPLENQYYALVKRE